MKIPHLLNSKFFFLDLDVHVDVNTWGNVSAIKIYLTKLLLKRNSEEIIFSTLNVDVKNALVNVNNIYRKHNRISYNTR